MRCCSPGRASESQSAALEINPASLAPLNSTQGCHYPEQVTSTGRPKPPSPPFETRWVGCAHMGVCLSPARKPISLCHSAAVQEKSLTSFFLSEQNKNSSVWICGINLAAPSLFLTHFSNIICGLLSLLLWWWWLLNINPRKANDVHNTYPLSESYYPTFTLK